MASNTKYRKTDLYDDVEGYIHSITEVKESASCKTKFFNGKIQEETQLSNMVCFTPDMHANMSDYAKKR